jgi:hypothetical protein
MGRYTQLLAAEGASVSLFVLYDNRFEATQLFRSGKKGSVQSYFFVKLISILIGTASISRPLVR